MSIALGMNVISVATSVAGFALTGNPVYGGEIPHSSADAGTYGSRLVAEAAGINQKSKKFKNFLRLTMAVPATLMLYKAYEAGGDLLNGEYLEYQPSRLDYLGSAALVSTTGVAYYHINKIDNHSAASRASLVHAGVDFVVTGLYGAGLVAGAAGAQAAPFVAATVGSTVGALHLFNEARDPHVD